jgi:colanic acid biosynthesis glycosyl transferase WcaI
MKILLLNQAFYPDVASSAQHLTDLALDLANRGHDVRVMCSRRMYDNPAVQHPRHEVWCGITIRRIYSFGFGKSARWRRYADFGSYLVNCLRHLIAKPRVDLVVAMTSPPLISWLGALFVRVKGGKFVFWVMDLNPDEALAAGWMDPGSWSTRRLQWMLRYSLHQAHLIVTLDRFMSQRVEDKGVDRAKITVLPPWSHDHQVYYNVEGREQFRKDHGLNGKFVVMYSGNHSPCHPLVTLLEAAHRLADQPDVAFCFVGGGAEYEKVRTFQKTHDLKNIVMVPYQPLNQLSASLSAADLHTVVMGDPFVGIVHTCKVYNIRTLGIPYLYIGPPGSHVTDMRPMFSARHGDVDTVVSFIRSAARAPARMTLAIDTAEHSQDSLVSKMIANLESVVFPDAKREQVELVRSMPDGQTRLLTKIPNGHAETSNKTWKSEAGY